MPPKYSRKPKAAKKTGRKYSKKSAYRQQKLSVATVKKIAAEVMTKKTETKQFLRSFAREALYHNGGPANLTGCQFNLTNQMPVQGSEEDNRIGCEIKPMGYRATLLFTLPADRLNTSIRVLVLSVHRGHNPLASYDSIFDSISTNVMTDPVDNDRVRVVKQLYINASKLAMFNPSVPTGTAKEITLFRVLKIPYKKIIKFTEDNQTSTSIDRELIIVCHAYDAWGTLTTDICAYAKCDAKLYFKDF